MEAQEFCRVLKVRGLNFFAGVPDSTFQTLYRVMLQDEGLRYIPAVRENVALGIASAAHFVGRRGGVIMQNSGIGNVVNPLTSFSLIYRIPLLLIIGWRGYGGPPNDAPEHWIMGAKTAALLDLMEIPYEILTLDNLETALDGLLARMEKHMFPGALLVRPGVIT